MIFPSETNNKAKSRNTSQEAVYMTGMARTTKVPISEHNKSNSPKLYNMAFSSKSSLKLEKQDFQRQKNRD